MRKIPHQWMAIGIISLISWGVGVMPINASWIPSTIMWGVAGIWLITTLVYLVKHRGETSHSDEEKVASLLEGVKSHLVTLIAYERDAATIKAKVPCSKETVEQIYDDFTSIFGVSVVSVIVSVLQEIVCTGSVDLLIAFFKKFGDILDSNGYGLKAELEKIDLYKSSRTDLAQKMVKLKMGKGRKLITQGNIDRVRSLSYGLSSSVLLRSVLDSVPEAKDIVPPVIRVTLESVEVVAEQTLNTMLNDLENEWKISKENMDGVESALGVLSVFWGVQEDE